MKKKNKLICIIPGLEKNNYSKKGDLVDWGGTTLLEWKISQALKIEGLQEIYITTPSSKIKSLASSLGVKTIMRNKGQSLNTLYNFIGKKFLMFGMSYYSLSNVPFKISNPQIMKL